MNKNSILGIALIYIIFLIFIFPSMRNCVEPTNGFSSPVVVDSPLIGEDLGTRILSTESPPMGEYTQEKTFFVKTKLLEIGISNLSGGTIVSAKIIARDDDGHLIYKNRFTEDNRIINLISQNSRNNFALKFASSRDTLDLSLVPFSMDESDDTLFVRDKPKKLQFYFSLPSGGKIVRSYEFFPEKYYLNSNIHIIGNHDLLGETYEVLWTSIPQKTENDNRDDKSYQSAYVLQGIEKPETIKGKENGERFPDSGRSVGDVHWMATRSKYFASAVVIPDGATPAKATKMLGFDAGKDDEKSFSISMFPLVSGLSNDGQSFQLFLGPLDYTIVNEFNPSLTQLMSFGWSFFSIIGRGILWLLIKIHALIGSYGISLVLFSILVKIVVYPLTQKSYASMEKMKTIQPEVEILKKKFAGNATELQKAQMKLFKEHNVSPLGGCLPMLIQMPIFVSLFSVFRSTIELRGEPFLWIDDLSMPDTVFHLPFSIPMLGDGLNILPFLMAGSMILQQKISSPVSGNSQQQKMMMYFLPIMLFVMFYRLSSGLNLYYFLFNMLTILQQKFIVKKNRAISPVNP